MGNAVQKEMEIALDLDEGDNLYAWAHTTLNFTAPASQRTERRIRNRLRFGDKMHSACQYGLGIQIAGNERGLSACKEDESNRSAKEGEFRAIVNFVDCSGEAHIQDVQVGDEVVYIDMFDVSDLSSFYSRVVKDSAPHAPPFTFEVLVDKMIRGSQGSVVRLGLIRKGSPIVKYKALSRTVPIA